MKKFFFVAATALVAAVSCPSMRAEGYNQVGVSYELETWSYKYLDKPDLNGFGIGYIHGFSLSKTTPVYLETGLKMTMGFWSETYKDGRYKEELDLTKMSFSVPVNVAYKFNFADGKMGLSPYLGINLKLNALAKMKFTEGDESESISLFDKDEMDDPASRFQCGWHIGARFNYGSILLGLEYGTDFNRFFKENNTGTFGVTLGYQF